MFNAGRDTSGLVPEPRRLGACLVIGAGVAGLQTARQLLKLNCQVLVLEEKDDIGGVWRQNYLGFGLQVPWRMYQFPEFLWPPDLQPAEEYPTGQQVQAYIKAYASHFGLLRYIRLNSKLLRLVWDPAARRWDAFFHDTSRHEMCKVSVDYVAMCSGIYSNPFVPAIEGADTFSGLQLHAKDFSDISVVKGRRVLIVGSGKTALDCAHSIVASGQAASVAMAFRKSHWPVPRNVLGLSIRKLVYNRAIASMLPAYYDAGPVGRAAAAVGKPLKWLFWRGLEGLISLNFNVTDSKKPHVRLPYDLFYGAQVVDQQMSERVDRAAVTAVRGEIRCLTQDGAEMQDGSFLAADVVLYCTGYSSSYDYLDAEMRARLDLQKDGLYLYRSCLAPRVPHLAFVGCEVSTFNNILTSGLQAMWLAGVLSGKVQLPPPEAMQADIRAQERWRREVVPPQRHRSAMLQLYLSKYHDQLLRDMGHSPRRKGLLHPFAECFAPYSAEDYGDLARQGPAEVGPAGRSRGSLSRPSPAELRACSVTMPAGSFGASVRPTLTAAMVTVEPCITAITPGLSPEQQPGRDGSGNGGGCGGAGKDDAGVSGSSKDRAGDSSLRFEKGNSLSSRSLRAAGSGCSPKKDTEEGCRSGSFYSGSEHGSSVRGGSGSVRGGGGSSSRGGGGAAAAPAAAPAATADTPAGGSSVSSASSPGLSPESPASSAATDGSFAAATGPAAAAEARAASNGKGHPISSSVSGGCAPCKRPHGASGQTVEDTLGAHSGQSLTPRAADTGRRLKSPTPKAAALGPGTLPAPDAQTRAEVQAGIEANGQPLQAAVGGPSRPAPSATPLLSIPRVRSVSRLSKSTHGTDAPQLPPPAAEAASSCVVDESTRALSSTTSPSNSGGVAPSMAATAAHTAATMAAAAATVAAGFEFESGRTSYADSCGDADTAASRWLHRSSTLFASTAGSSSSTATPSHTDHSNTTTAAAAALGSVVGKATSGSASRTCRGSGAAAVAVMVDCGVRHADHDLRGSSNLAAVAMHLSIPYPAAATTAVKPLAVPSL